MAWHGMAWLSITQGQCKGHAGSAASPVTNVGLDVHDSKLCQEKLLVTKCCVLKPATTSNTPHGQCLTYLGPEPLCNSGIIGCAVLERFPSQALPVLDSLLAADVSCQMLE